MLRSSLERKERERDELQRRMQALPTQPQPERTPLSSFNMAEAHKQVATLTQQLAFKEEEVQQSCMSMSVFCLHHDDDAGVMCQTPGSDHYK